MSARTSAQADAGRPDDAIPTEDLTLRLRDGRILGYALWGDAAGSPLLYFGSSRLEAAVLAEPARRAGVRLIGVDRPGMGRSSFHPGRRLLDWPDDVIGLADHLGLDRFAVVGVSGGGPHALACALIRPERLTACGVVSGVGPGAIRLYQRNPWLLTAMTWVMCRFFRREDRAERSLVRLTRGWPESDRNSLEVPGVRKLWAASLAESFRQGARGMCYDSVLVEASPWGFDPADIRLPRLFLWHGERDKDVPVAMGRAVAARIPSCAARFFPGEGHLSVIVNHGAEIVRALA